jgi:hypothetical protein
VVVPVPDAWTLTWRKKGKIAKRVLSGWMVILIDRDSTVEFVKRRKEWLRSQTVLEYEDRLEKECGAHWERKSRDRKKLE